MIELIAYDYINAEILIHSLADCERKLLKIIDDKILELIDILEFIQFNVSVQAAQELFDITINLKKAKVFLVTSNAAKELKEKLQFLEKTLHAESKTKHAFIMTDKRYNLKYLIYTPEKMFSPGTFELLPDLSQYDFREAFKCIAFERSTAAAFHLLRGTEAVLRELYLCKIREKRLDKKQRMWGSILEVLKQRKTSKLPESLIMNLDNIRKNYRNPTQHPEEIYDIDSVQGLLGLCIDVVDKMVFEIKKRPRRRPIIVK